MTATFSPEEAARLAAFDAASDAPESWAATVERMARAMWESDSGDVRWIATAEGSYLRARYRRLAAAAFRAEHEGGAA